MFKKITLFTTALFLIGCESIPEIFVEDKSDGKHEIEQTESITQALENTMSLSSFKLRYDIREGDQYTTLTHASQETKVSYSKLSETTNSSSLEEKFLYLDEGHLVQIESYKLGDALFAKKAITTDDSLFEYEDNFILDDTINLEKVKQQLNLLSLFTDDDFKLSAEKDYLLKEDSIKIFCENYTKETECIETMQTYQVNMGGYYINAINFHGKTFDHQFSQTTKVNLEIYNVNNTEVTIPKHTFDGVNIKTF